MSKRRNESQENPKERAEDPDFDEYYDMEGKDKVETFFQNVLQT